jgi:hypothetical protein
VQFSEKTVDIALKKVKYFLATFFRKIMKTETSIITAKGVSRRSFLKNTSLGAASIVILNQGIALAEQDASQNLLWWEIFEAKLDFTFLAPLPSNATQAQVLDYAARTALGPGGNVTKFDSKSKGFAPGGVACNPTQIQTLNDAGLITANWSSFYNAWEINIKAGWQFRATYRKAAP